MILPKLTDLNVYVWQDVPNWGDQLGYYLLNYHLGHKYRCRMVDKIQQADIVGIGSTLAHIPDDWTGIIAGTGKLRNEPLDKTFPNANILGVRGHHSLSNILGVRDIYWPVVGDPGLITPHIIHGTTSESADIGILPHWSDTALKWDSRFRGPWTTKFINPFRPIWNVIWDVMACKKIVTSSLHGTVIADAYGIPRRIVPSWGMLNSPYEGGMFKFEDYMSALRMEYVPEVLDRPDPDRVESVQDDILDLYQNLTYYVDQHIANNNRSTPSKLSSSNETFSQTISS